MSVLELIEPLENHLDAQAKRRKYINDPVLWAKDVAGMHLWSKQAAVARDVATKQNVAVKAGHGVGKSLLAGVLICWWIDTRYPDCFVASTAPSTAQIGAIVWREIHNIRARIEKRYKEGLVDHILPGYITSDNIWKTDAGVPVGFGRKPPDQKTDDAFQGIHAAGGVLAIGDEAVGLTEEMIDALGNITSTKNSCRLLICNPTNPASYVGKLFKEKPKNWEYHTISVLDSPNFTDEKYVTPPEVLEALTDQSYVDSKREEYGEGSPRWKSRVEGEFAWDMGFTLIRLEDLAKGMDCQIVPSLDSKPRLGVDVSRSKKGDVNTIYKWHDGHLRLVEAWNEANAMRTADKIHEHALAAGVDEVRIDGVGLGGPIADRVRELSRGKYEVIEILGGNPSPDPDRWFNTRSFGWWNLQNLLATEQVDIDPLDEDLQDQLMSIELKKKASGRDTIQLESKVEAAKRGIHSPDHADAAVYAALDLSWWLGGEPEGSVVAQDREEIPDYGLSAYISRPGTPFFRW